MALIYKLNKHFRFIAGGRFGQKDPFNELYQNRERYFTSVNFKTKYKKFEFGFRDQLQILLKHKKGLETVLYNRTKFIVGYDLNKRLSFSIAEEFFTPLNSFESYTINRHRTSLSSGYKISKSQSLEFSFLFQSKLYKNNKRDFIYGLNYIFSL